MLEARGYALSVLYSGSRRELHSLKRSVCALKASIPEYPPTGPNHWGFSEDFPLDS